MTILSQVYSGHEVSDPLIPCLEIDSPAFESPIRNCAGFEDQTVTLENDNEVTFLAAGLDVALPERSTRGQQDLVFAIDGVTGEAQRAIDVALKAGEKVTVVYREYLESDKTAPARKPTTMSVVGASFDGTTTQITCSYRDILNWRWPRKRYTLDFAPGLKYL